jgi:hypothetical protein
LDDQRRDSIAHENQDYASNIGELAMTKPSPLPWSIDALGYIRGADNTNVLEIHENAEFVCKSVNLFPRLVEALEGMVLALEKDSKGNNSISGYACARLADARDVLKEARGVK